MTTDNTFAINPTADINVIGQCVSQAMFDDDITIDGHRDVLSMIHSYIYPNASRPATAEENAALAANEPNAANALPCPYCGEHNPIVTTDETGAFQMYCTVCFASGPSASNFYGAVTLWNEREV